MAAVLEMLDMSPNLELTWQSKALKSKLQDILFFINTWHGLLVTV